MKIERTLTDGTILTIETEIENGKTFYRAKVSGDKWNSGFEDDRGEVKEGETLTDIADSLEVWLNENITGAKTAESAPGN